MGFYFSGDGRVGLGQFWLHWLLPLFGAIVVASVLDGILFSGLIDPDGSGIGPLAGITLLLSIWPGFAVGAKRLHDIGWNGWLMLLSLVPLANLVIWVATWFVPGNRGENKYGPDPRTPQEHSSNSDLTTPS